jgi:hypothetical protein
MIGGKKGVYGGWAPASVGNNTANYIKYIAKQTGYDPNVVMSEGAEGGKTPPALVAPEASPSLPSSEADTDADTDADANRDAAGPDSSPAGIGPGGPLAATAPPPVEGAGPQGPTVTPDAQPSDAQPPAAAPSASAATAPAPPLASQIIPSAAAPDPFSRENIDRTRELWDTITGDSPRLRAQMEQQRAATIQQLQQLRDESLDRYHNPSPWSFLSNIAAGMGASKSLNLAGAFGEGVGLASQRRDAEQQQALANTEALEKNIEAIQTGGLSERDRQAGQMITLLTRPNQQQASREEFNKFLENGTYGRKDQSPGANYAFREDPTAPGWGAWVRTDQPLKQPTQKTGSRQEQEFAGATNAIKAKYNISTDTPFEKLPLNVQQEIRTLADTKQAAPLDATTRDYYVKQVQKDGQNWSLVPAEWKTQVGQALAAGGVDVARLDATTRALQAPQDPKEVAYMADQVQQDRSNWAMLSGNKGMQEAVRKELSNRGVNVANLDAQTRQTAEFAQTVKPHIQEIYKLIDAMPAEKIGPVFGRWNEFLAGKFGAGDPDYVRLRNNINLLDSAVARIHGGARGGGSPPMIEYMHNMLGAGPKDAATMRAGLDVFNEWVNRYAQMAPEAGAASPSFQQPPRPKGVPATGAAQYNPATKQWRFKPQGSDQWQILPQ